jgi:hypothetical protein
VQVLLREIEDQGWLARPQQDMNPHEVEHPSSTLFCCDLPDRSCGCCGIFLGQVMADVRNDAMLAPVDELRCRRFPIRCRHDAVSLPVQRDRRLYGEPFPKLLVRWVARRKARDGSAPGIHRRHQKREGRRCRYPSLNFTSRQSWSKCCPCRTK